MALVTVPKIIGSLQPNQQMVVFDDGSFDDECVEKIQSLSPKVTVVVRKERDERILAAIGKRPNSIKYRQELPLAYKLLDIPLTVQSEGGRFTFTDTDIIYLRHCEDYFTRSANTYLRTDAIKLSIKLQDGLLKYRWPIPVRFNSGYFSFDIKDYDLDFVEYYLGLPDVRNSPWLSEQTCWALLFGKAGPSFSPLENQFACREKFQGPQSDTLAIHLIGGLKGKFRDWSQSEAIPAGTAAAPAFELSRNVTLFDWAQKSARRFMKKG